MKSYSVLHNILQLRVLKKFSKSPILTGSSLISFQTSDNLSPTSRCNLNIQSASGLNTLEISQLAPVQAIHSCFGNSCPVRL